MSLPVRFKQDMLLEAGVDEAGRGCLWGPLYAAAVIWPPESEWLEDHHEIASQIKDSKKLSAKKRNHLASAIQSLATDFGIGIVSPKEIDDHGMTYANRLAFLRAIDALTVEPDRVLLDGILALPVNEVSQRSIVEQETIVDGDAKYLPIAAASIVAKEARDAAVAEAVTNDETLESKYSIGSSKGYGTEKHRKGILAHGMQADHRKLFLRKLLGNSVLPQTDCLIIDT